MKEFGTDLRLSATDLANFLGCRHRTALDMGAARRERVRPHRHEPILELLFARGLAHERRYVELLRARGHRLVELDEFRNAPDIVARTLDAMRDGAAVIAQGALADGPWFGYPDLLIRVETPSMLGDWSYEIADTKLAAETRGGTILQLGLYSEMLAVAQGAHPEAFRVVTPGPEPAIHRYRVDDFAAYFRLVRRQMQETVALDWRDVAGLHYPEPVEHCAICPWYRPCVDKRHEDDHLSLVAGISRLHRRELEARGITTLTSLANLTLPLSFKPRRGSIETYLRVREQARVQLESRDRHPPAYELRALEGGRGFARLPEPSPGDIFLDLEGDSFAVEGGREYLIGVVTIDERGAPAYRAFWGFTEHDERVAFETVIDLIMNAWARHPGMHIYHYAPYEPSAFKRLMGRYVTREADLDRLLRAGRFIDLYAVVRQAMLVGVERYSIKDLEPLYGFRRTVELPDAGRSLRAMELALGLGNPESVPPEIREAVERYNQDDCVSTLRLRDWLEDVRAGAEAAGTPIPRPTLEEGAAPEKVDERAQKVAQLREQLLRGVPEDPAARADDRELHARWLLAYLLDWHRREDKVGWWEYFRLRELPEEELADEPQAVAGLEFVGCVGERKNKKTGKPTGTMYFRYRFPPQEIEITKGETLKLQDGSVWGEVVGIDRDARTIDVARGRKQADVHATAAFAHTFISTEVLERAIAEVASAVLREGRVAPADGGSHRPARELLLGLPPRLRSGAFTCVDNPDVAFAVRTVRELDESVLAIQGPPGSGKTYCAARMICALVAQGKKVGVTAISHKVIRNLLDAVAKAALEEGTTVRLAHKADDDDGIDQGSSVVLHPGNGDAHRAVVDGTCDVLGGTAWIWARPEFAGAVDVLFVDEAGQMSLANVVAVSRAAKSLVLLGDPRQLDQPRKGSHPDGVDASALEHILGEQQTMPADRGIFFPITWRLAPEICAFTSEVFYETKLRSRDGLERQRLDGCDLLDGAGLWVLDVPHDGNRNYAEEEISAVERLIARLTAPGVRWSNERGQRAALTGEDILVVAPYNAQVSRLQERLRPTGARVGTVDKFQGQEAPVVIYSMATSRPEDAPRGMEFLYSVNRLNVATSRARCAVVLVASPSLFEPECHTPRQMKLANALCRYRELARVLPGGGVPTSAVDSSPTTRRANSRSVQ